MKVGVHWLRATTKEPVDQVVGRLVEVLNEQVQVRDGAHHGYSETIVLGPVKVWHNPDRLDMGCCVEVTGEACEEIGPDGLLSVWGAAEWRASRVDVAVDHCPFTPRDVADAWRAGQVDTRVKVLDPSGKRRPMDGREDWRRCEWVEQPDGDLFGMGSRASGQYARVYDSRGFTRFELELKRETAHVAGPVVMAALAGGAEKFREVALGLVQRFVRFVDRTKDENVTRCPELAWWTEFVEGVGKARLTVAKRVIRTVSEVVAWVEKQVAPSLAIVSEVLGDRGMGRLVTVGRSRWGPRQRDTLALARRAGAYAAV